MQKVYCYVDESGQDTKGEVFVVAVVVAAQRRDELLTRCEHLEEASGKRKDKWGAAKHERRMRYLRHVFADDRFKGALRYAVFHETRNYDEATVDAIDAALEWQKPTQPFTTFMYVDGLSKTKRHKYAVALRRRGQPVRQVRGIARDESNALIRLADAVSGFVRDALKQGEGEIAALYRQAKRAGMLIELRHQPIKKPPTRGGRA